jgi:hypothetical protein
MSEDLKILKQLIKEVKTEMKGGLLKENKEPKVTGDTLKEYILKDVMKVIRESGE